MIDPFEPLLPDFIRLHARWRGASQAIVAPGGSLTWSEFDRRVDQVAAGLAGMGLAPGERVGMLASNRLATAEMIWGVLRAGLVIVPLNPSVTDAVAYQMFDDAGVSAIFATEDHADRLGGYGIAHGRRLIARPEGAAAPAGWTDYEPWRAVQLAEPIRVRLDADAPCNIIYSSGTTGLPKGIVHNLGGRTDWARDVALALRYHPSARSLVCTGLYSNITWAAMLSSILVGATLVVHETFDVPSLLKDLSDRAITHLAMVPVQYQRVIDHVDFRADMFASLESMMCVGATLPVPIKSRLVEAAPGRLIELWGLTEGILTVLEPEDAGCKLTSVGKPLFGSDIRLVDASDHLCGPDEQGEIVGRSRYPMSGYWNQPDVTREAIWVDGDGRSWLRTGDIGRLDAEGFLSIVDRKKDMIVSGGQNVYPADIEAVLCLHEDVVECAVIGVPSAQWGETPLALVVTRRNDPDPIGLLDWVNLRLGRQQKLSGIEFRDALPRNPAGKVLKRELRQPYW